MSSLRFKTILVALDNSPRAPAVLDHAAELARRFGGQLVLFRAVGIPLEIPPQAFSQPPAALPRLLEAHARDELAARAKELPPSLVLRS